MKRIVTVAAIWAGTAFLLFALVSVVFVLLAAGFQAVRARSEETTGPVWPSADTVRYLLLAGLFIFFVTFIVKFLRQYFSLAARKTWNSPTRVKAKLGPAERVACPTCRAANGPLAVWCGSCGRLLVSFDLSDSFVFMLSVLVALALARSEGSTWPLYLLTALGILHLYAVTFSRGEALTSAALSFAIVVVVWGAWAVVDWLGQSADTAGPFSFVNRIYSWQEEIRPSVPLLAIPLWGVGIALGLGLGGKIALPGIRLASSYFLGTGAFVLGLWGTWAILVEHAQIPNWLYNAVVLLALLAPLVLLVVLLERDPPIFTSEQPIRPTAAAAGQFTYVVAIWLFVATAYLLSARTLVNIVELSLTRFVPQLLGQNPLPGPAHPWLLIGLSWTSPMAGIAAAIAVLSIVTSSAVVAAAGYRQIKPTWYEDGIDRITRLMSNPSTAVQDVGTRVQANTEGMILAIRFLLYNAASFSQIFLVSLAENLQRTIRQLGRYAFRLFRFVVIPVVAFSALGALVILVLQNYRTYLAGQDGYPPEQLWGSALAVAIIALLLCGASFGFAPATSRNFLFDGTAAALQIGIIFYLTFSLSVLVEPLLWGSFLTVGRDLEVIRPGPIFATNGIAILALVIGLAIAWKLKSRSVPQLEPTSNRRTIPSFGSTALDSIQILPFVVFAVVAIGFGWRPIVDGLWGLFGW